jgi:DNA mismatch repair protein MutL
VIRVLDLQTIGQIAAGEVIERPVSVVKELVENALDADATRIAVRVQGGGLLEIEVSDDGTGIAPAELPLAVRRHATSKLSDAGGLTSVDTLGFRGEGLASIAAVARVTLSSRGPGAEVATGIDAHAEEASEPYAVAGPPGTRVAVRALFANVPVRREYLRSPAAEFNRIASWLATLSLAYPRVAFRLEHDGKTTFTFAGGDDLAERLRYVFGTGAAAMLPVRAAEAGARVQGWVSAPGDDRADRRSQIVFVNGRLLRSTIVSGAWSAAYRTFAMVGRHPYGVLYLSVPPSEVDPNVHPTKSDVRLRYGDRVVAVVKEAISAALRHAAVERLEHAVSFAAFDERDVGERTTVAWADSFIPSDVPDANASAGGLRVLAQVDRTFILATDGDAVVLIDQHAAHERVVYEQLSANAGAHRAAEPLLIPHTFEIGPEQAERLEASLDALAAGGLHVERFGERAFRVTATPARLAHAGRSRPFDVDEFIACLADEARGLDADQRVWASLACHSVVRAGDVLAYAEMTVLVTRLTQCENPMHCPHGRPTIVRLEAERIARLFKRI